MAGRSGGGLHEDHPVRDELFEEVPHKWHGQGLHQVHIVGRDTRQTLPQVVTLASVLDAVVLDDSALSPEGATLLRDIATEWQDWSELSATQHMFENYASQTTVMSKTDPGWDMSDVSQITDAKITHSAAIFIFDFVVKKKLFNFCLLLGCVPLMAKHTLIETMAANNPWPKPVTVCGYDNTGSLAGSIYEAETKCTSTHNWGQVASDTANNMAPRPEAPRPEAARPEAATITSRRQLQSSARRRLTLPPRMTPGRSPCGVCGWWSGSIPLFPKGISEGRVLGDLVSATTGRDTRCTHARRHAAHVPQPPRLPLTTSSVTTPITMRTTVGPSRFGPRCR